ncbi:hypothetical protein VC83_06722 [Pseudogymnoascus destructans]|uniref:Uncharacterized protein n=1 Tax=Pseudogymnoascus destructans TaxID=655981 RepID=A0A177A593_9PEZI|nr:uncharacterized protein VC83_06722 [Pseudogymnoascus destructans]OAF56253.1 hypothetical protein VC83_06722 [Pseudogymnoascus destructans]
MAPKKDSFKGKGKAKKVANPPPAPRASPVEARLTEAECLGTIDAMVEKKQATAVKAAATKARNKKAKEEAAARSLTAARGKDEAPLASIEGYDARPSRTLLPLVLLAVGALLLALDALIQLWTCAAVMAASPSKILRKKAKLNLCLRCSKQVYKDRRLLACEKKNPMSHCEYCVEQHNKCLPIPTFALRQFNRLADAFQLYRDTIQRDEETFSKTLANNRTKILAAVQKKYTAYPQKVNLGLAILEIASEVRSLRRTNHLGNDIQKAIHCHLPDVALAEEYKSSDSEDDVDREHVDGELEPLDQ